jgi:hypothetical protein
MSVLLIGSTSLTGSIPQEVRQSVSKRYHTGLDCGRIGVALYFGVFVLYCFMSAGV